jgi:hypothetical protein
MLTGDAALDDSAEAFTGVLVDDRHNLDRPAIGGDIELEVHRPTPGRAHPRRPSVARLRCHGVWVAAAPQSFVAPKALDLLVVDGPALGAGIVVGGAESAAAMFFGVLAQPSPQGGVWIIWCPRDGLMTLGGAVLPGNAADEPFADPQHPLQVTNGCARTFRGLEVSLGDLPQRVLLQLGVSQ